MNNRIKPAYILTIAVMLLMLAEIFLRLFVSTPSVQRYDAELGYSNSPGAKIIDSMEGYGFNVFNSMGFNDDEPDPQLKNKIFVIGDSYTEALQVARPQCYTSLLQDKLKSDNIDIIKLARDGYVPYYYPLVSERYYDRFSPELTIIELGVHTVSDLYIRKVKIIYDSAGKISSYKLAVDKNDKAKQSLRILINHSSLAYYLMRKYKSFLLGQMARVNRIKSWLNWNKSEQSDNESFSVSKQADRADNVARLEYALSHIKGKKLIVYIPEPGILFDINKKLNKFSSIIKDAAIASGSDYLDLTEAFREHYMRSHVLLNGFNNSKPAYGHLNSNGHKLVAEQIYRKLDALGYLNKP